MHAELWFLVDAFTASAAVDTAEGAVLERPIDEHLWVFASDCHARGALTEDEYRLLTQLGELLPRVPVDVLVYLHAPAAELARRVAERQWRGEELLTPERLEDLALRYDDFVGRWHQSPIVRINTAEIDVRTEHGVQEVVEHVHRART